MTNSTVEFFTFFSIRLWACHFCCPNWATIFLPKVGCDAMPIRCGATNENDIFGIGLPEYGSLAPWSLLSWFRCWNCSQLYSAWFHYIEVQEMKHQNPMQSMSWGDYVVVVTDCIRTLLVHSSINVNSLPLCQSCLFDTFRSSCWLWNAALQMMSSF